MRKKQCFFKKALIAVLSIGLILGTVMIPGKKAEAAVWYSGDPFTDIGRSKKGTQSFLPTEVVNTSNIFINAHMETSFPKDDKSDIAGFSEFDFENEKYYFKIPKGMESYASIVNLNNADLTVTVQFILKYDPEKARLVEPSARAYPGLAYYAPNMTEPDVVKEYRAYMAFLAEIFSLPQCHVDAWVCGNEVNAGYHWNFFGTDCMSFSGGEWKVSNPDLLVDKYAKFYDIVYDAMKANNKKTRVCICVDHCWTENERGVVIPTKTFLDMFAAREGNDKDWCIAYHAYPADLTKPDIWSNWNGHVWNQKNENAQFVDGYNLEILTDYVKNHFGSNHRIMLTEQGFTKSQGEDVQAASLVYTFYKARFDDMIDVFHIMKFPGCGYELGDKASQIWEKLDNGKDADEQWILSQVGGTLGINSFSQITPYWKSQGTIQAEITAFKEANPCFYHGVDYSPVFDYEYFVAENPVLYTFWDRKPTFDEAFWYFSVYAMDRTGEEKSPIMKSHPDFDLLSYKAEHPELVAQFQENNRAYYTYYCEHYSEKQAAEERAAREQIVNFVERFYTEILGRDSEEAGLENWTLALVAGTRGGADVAFEFIKSPEFQMKDETDEEYITRLYHAFFNREPDEPGMESWLKDIENGKDRDFILNGFLVSEEFRALCEEYGINRDSTRSFVRRFYKIILGRTDDQITPAELDNWQIALDAKAITGSDMAREWINDTPEFQARVLTDEEYVQILYNVVFDRDADPTGLATWTGELEAGKTRAEVLDAILASPEFKDTCAGYGIDAE